MKKKDIVEVIYQNSEYKKSDIQDIVDMVFDVMAQSLEEEEKIMISIDQTKQSNPGAGSKLERHSLRSRTILPCYLKANMFVGLGRRKIPSTKHIFHFNGHLLL